MVFYNSNKVWQVAGFLHCMKDLKEVGHMLKVQFYDSIDDSLLQYAVIVSKYNGKWVFCKHKQRSTYECPGGHREADEMIEQTARRELWEETGAVDFTLQQICVYSVVRDDSESFGMLYFAEIHMFESLPTLEIEKIEFLETLPAAWTYPLIQPKLVEQVEYSLQIA